MDAVISSSASVTGSFLQVQHQLQLPLRTVSAYASTSSSVPLSQKQRQRQRQRQRQSLSSHRIRLTFRNYSSALPKLRVTCGSAVTEINESQFKETVLKANRPVLVEFVATWCGPCRLISPVIESLAQEYEDRLMVVKIDHDANPRLIEEYKVYGLPTLILFKNGEEVPESRREGASAKEKLRVYLDALLESISVS